MIKLLRGDFTRLFKSKIFWLGVIFMFGFAAAAVYTKWDDARRYPDYYNPPDGILLTGGIYISIALAIFIGIFVGTDYSSGTIRNKHIMGHSRAAMYFSNLIICVVASLIMHLVHIGVIVGAVNLGIIREFTISAGTVAAQILISIFSVAAVSAILLFVCMLISSRTIGVVTAIILSVVMIISASSIDNRLREREYTLPGFNITIKEDGSMLQSPMDLVKNPKYVSGTKRKVLEFFNDLLPINQICQMLYGKPNADSETTWGDDINAFLPLYSLAMTTVITTAGVLLFRKKDLK